MDNKQYVMFYEAVAADNSRSIGLAVSPDGVSDWERHPQPVLTAATQAGGGGSSGMRGA